MNIPPYVVINLKKGLFVEINCSTVDFTYIIDKPPP